MSGPLALWRRRVTRLVRGIRQAATPRILVVIATVGSLTLAFVVSAIWFGAVDGTSRFEPAVESLGLLAGITGIVVERRAASRERRHEALRAIREELEANQAILDSPPFVKVTAPSLRRQVYRRLYLSAVETALSSGALSPRRDGHLSGLLHAWRDEVGMFNHQLLLAEILAFTAESDETLRDLHEGLHGVDGPLRTIRAKLDDLLSCLASSDQ